MEIQLQSLRQVLSRVLIIFIYENECSTDVVPTGMVRQTFARVLKLGQIVCSIELVANSFKKTMKLDATSSELNQFIIFSFSNMKKGLATQL